MRWFLVLFILSASTLLANAQDANKISNEFAAKWVKAYDAGDASALGALFTQDGVFNTPQGLSFKGRDAIAKALANRIKIGWTKETVITKEARMAGDAVWAAGDYHLLGSGEKAILSNSGDTNPKLTGGLFGWVLVRDRGGWHIAMLTATPQVGDAESCR
jgi:uncharacterized protein (TIGR02246 family)